MRLDASSLNVPLYHGTSSLFLEDILRLGLGGKNPLTELDLFRFIADLRPLIKAHLSGTAVYKSRATSFASMVEQSSGSLNFQHGQSYLSPSKSTAIRYAVNTRYGSELLTYALDFLQLLVDREAPTVKDVLFRKYRNVFKLLDISPAPILVQAEVSSDSGLLTEHGHAPRQALDQVAQMMIDFPDDYEPILAQTNFRLISPIPKTHLRIWFINVTRWHALDPNYVLYELPVQSLDVSVT